MVLKIARKGDPVAAIPALVPPFRMLVLAVLVLLLRDPCQPDFLHFHAFIATYFDHETVWQAPKQQKES
jgi:hypothetical protein